MRIFHVCGWLCAILFSVSSEAVVAPPALGDVAPAQRATPERQPVITLAAAIELALSQHPAVRDKALGLEAGAAAIQQAGQRPNPVLTLESENVRQGNQTVSLWWTQPLEMGDKRARRLAVAERERALAELSLIQERANVVANVRLAYMKALIWRQRISWERENLVVVTSWANAMQERVQQGRASALEGDRARLARLAAADALQRAEREWSIAMNELAARLGQDEPPAISSSGIAASFLPPWERVQSLLPLAAKARSLGMTLEQRSAEFELQRSVASPDVRLSAGIQNDRMTGRNGLLLGISMPIAISNRNQGAIEKANLQVQQAREQEAAGRRDLEVQALAAWERLRALQKTIRVNDDELVPGAERAFAQARAAFDLGNVPFIDVLDAHRALAETRVRYTQSLLEYVETEAALEKLLGVPLSELAAAPPETHRQP